MNIKSDRERLRIATGAAAMEPKVLRFRPDPSPCPGDTFVLHATADFPVEWAIVERDLEDAGRLRVVPVDNYPQIGSHDVGLRLLEPGRVANIRCDLDTWLPVSKLRAERRTGTLPLESLERVRRKCDALAAGDVEASLLEEDVDVDPEYRRWKDETLQGALALLKKTGRQEPELRAMTPRLLALAASVLLAVSVWSVREVRQLGDRLAVEGRESEDVIAALQLDYHELEAAASGNAAKHEQQAARLRRELDTTERELRVAQSDFTQPNVPWGVFEHDTQRSAVQRRGSLELVEQTLQVRRDATHVVLVLEVVDAEPYDRYRLQILDDTTEEVAWSDERLVRSGSVVSLAMPASVLDLRRYRLVLSGIEEGKAAVRLKEGFLLTVEEAYD